MSLTYQPFAETPAVESLREDLNMNVPDGERAVSAFAGASLVALAFGRESMLTKVAFLVLGGALIRRGVTGHCPMYARADFDRRHSGRGVADQHGARVEDAIVINCPAEVLFHFWRDLDQLPQVLRHVKSVEVLGNKRSRWTISGPAGISFQWDAEIVNEEENRMIAWESLPGATIRNAGSIWFEPASNGATRVKIAFAIDPPGGAAGIAVAEALGRSPAAELAEDLARFKAFAESQLSGKQR